MPYLIGSNAIRRTLKYLEQGKLFLRNNVKIMTVYYSEKGDYNAGTKDFVHWNLCQVQHKNPDVQVLFFKNMFPTPFIRCWLDTGEDVVMDTFNKNNIEIMDYLVKILGRPEERKSVTETKKISDFGSGCERHCMCEIPGQVPCPQIVPLPKEMRWKYVLEANAWPKKGLHKE